MLSSTVPDCERGWDEEERDGAESDEDDASFAAELHAADYR